MEAHVELLATPSEEPPTRRGQRQASHGHAGRIASILAALTGISMRSRHCVSCASQALLLLRGVRSLDLVTQVAAGDGEQLSLPSPACVAK